MLIQAMLKAIQILTLPVILNSAVFWHPYQFRQLYKGLLEFLDQFIVDIVSALIAA
jgi:hypothetical protein